MSDFDVAVVGAGIAGAATARALARDNLETVLLEQFALGHTRGSSHGTSRIFRYSYANPSFVRDCMDSLPLWRELEEETCARLYTRTGGFDVGENAPSHWEALEECGAKSEFLDPAEASRRFPGVSFPEDATILFQPDAGINHADACLRACVESAVRHGAKCREGERVDGLEPDEDGVTIHTSGETLRARAVVVTAGAWSKDLLAGCGIDLDVTVTCETVVYFPFEEGATIPSLVDWSSQPPFFALAAPRAGLKAGWHHAGPVLPSPDAGAKVRIETVEAVMEWVRERFPGARPRPSRAETCLYTNTSDETFVLRREGPVVVGSACSGHGFKFGLLTGRRLADLARELL